MITLEKKKQIVEEIQGYLEKASAAYLIDFESMTVAEANNFRGELRKGGFDYKVAKNTAFRRAIEGNEKFAFPETDFKGYSGMVFGYEDPVTPAKIIKKAFDTKERPKLKAAIIDGKYFDSTQLKTLASLPTKEEIMAAIVGSINAPASGIHGAISAVMRDLANVIHVGIKAKSEVA